MVSHILSAKTLAGNLKIFLLIQKLFVSIKFFLPLFFSKIGLYFGDNNIRKTLRPKLAFYFFEKINILFFKKFIESKAFVNDK